MRKTSKKTSLFHFFCVTLVLVVRNMERKSLMPADTYIVTSKTILSSEDHKLLSSLYQPIVGSVAISLYFSLWSYLDGSECLSLEWSHHQLMTNMKLKLSEIEVARTKLEAIELLKTYFKEDHINHYVYQLYAPLSSREFFHNPILNTTLQNNVGKKEYEKLVERYQIPKVPLHDYQDITCKFNDVFESVSTYEMNEEDNLKQREKRQLELTSKIDLDHVFSMIPEDYFLVSSVTRDMRDFIYKLSFIYDFDEEALVKILMNSINEKKMIDKDLLRTQARNIYRFENGGKTPTLIYKNEPEAKRVSGKSPLTKKAKLIYQFETTTPHDFLALKYGGIEPTKQDLMILEYLLVDLKLTPGVVNVLIDYVLKVNHNKLTRAFIETIAGQWCREHIETVEDAMNQCIAETKRKKEPTKQQPKQIVKKPKWFDEKPEVELATPEEMEEMNAFLKQFE